METNQHRTLPAQSNSISITRSAPEAQKGGAVTIDYEFRSAPGESTPGVVDDFRESMRSQNDQIVSDILRWHSSTSRFLSKHVRYWSFHPASRLVLWEPPVFEPLVFAACAAKWFLNSSYRSLRLTNCPVEVGQYLREFFSAGMQSGILVSQPSETLLKEVRRKSSLTGYVKQLLRFVILAFVSWGTSLPKKIKGKIAIFETVQVQKTHSGRKHFYGDMFSSNVIGNPSNVVFLSKYEGSLSGIIKRVRSKERFSEHPLISYLRPWHILPVLVSIFRDELAIASSSNRLEPIQILGLSSSVFCQNFRVQCLLLRPIFEEHVVFRTMQCFLDRMSPTRVFYPYEEKGMERALLLACSLSVKKGSKVKTVGYAHPIYNDGLTYLKRSDRGIELEPDMIACPGPTIMSWLQSWAGFKESKLHMTGSHRYFDSSRAKTPREPGYASAGRGANRKVLVLIGQGHEALLLANLLASRAESFRQWSFSIRRYPFAWLAEQEEGVQRMKNAGFKLQEESLDLATQVQRSDVVLTCSTSASIEAVHMGRVVVYFDLNHIFDLNPFKGKAHSDDFMNCHTTQELVKVLDVLGSHTAAELEKINQRQRQVAENIFAKIDIQEMRNVLGLSVQS